MLAKDKVMRFDLRRAACTGNNWLLFSLIGAIVLLGVFAIWRTIDSQQHVAKTFNGWYDDARGYQQAVADQRASGKPILVYFYATWCPHCKRFTAEILSDPKMKAYVQQYPHVRIAPDNGQAEQKIMSEYGVEGFPSFFVAKRDGNRVKIETHTTNGGNLRLKTPAEFIESVEEAAH